MWGASRRRHGRSVAPRLVVAGDTFAPGTQLSGYAVLGTKLGDCRIELRHVVLVHGTKVYGQPVQSHPLRAELAHLEQRFVLDIPARAPVRDTAGFQDPVEDAGWEVLLVIDHVQRASSSIRIE